MAKEVEVDERGIPLEIDEKGICAPHCPPKPCDLCTGNSAVVKECKPPLYKPIYKTSWEWCKEMDTCAATVDWDKVYDR